MNPKRVLTWWGAFLWLAVPHEAAAQTPLSSLILDGAGRDIITSVVSLPDGAAFVGVTTSDDLPTTMGPAYAGDDNPEGAGDVFVGRTSKSGQILWLRYLGGSKTDFGNGIAWDGDQTLTISGWTTSSDLPMENPIQSTPGGKSDTLIAQFNMDGTLLFSTFYGGDEDDQWAAVAWHPEGRAWIFGGFTSTPHSATAPHFPFPANNPSGADQSKASNQDTDGLFMVLNEDRSIRLASYHGRTTGKNEIIYAVDAGNFEEFIIAGTTDDSNFYNNGAFSKNGGGTDFFVNRIDINEGVRRWSKSLGYAGDETAFSVSYSPANSRVAVAGKSTSSDIGVSSYAPSKAIQVNYGGGESDAFIWVFDAFDQLTNGHPTFIGGTGNDSIRSISFAEDGDLLFAGTTDSPNLPFPTNPSFTAAQSTFGGDTDGFYGRVGFTGFSNYDYIPEALSYLGSAEEDGLLGIAVDASTANNDIGYLPVLAGVTRSANGSLRPASLPRVENTSAEAAFLQFFGISDASYDLRVENISVPEEFQGYLPYGSLVPVEVTFINDGPETVHGDVTIAITVYAANIPDSLSRHLFPDVFPDNIESISEAGFRKDDQSGRYIYTYTTTFDPRFPDSLQFKMGRRITYRFNLLAKPFDYMISYVDAINIKADISVKPIDSTYPEPNTSNNSLFSPFSITNPEGKPVSASGGVFLDKNSNGTPDQGEGLSEGVTVGVWKAGELDETYSPNSLGQFILFLEENVEQTVGLVKKTDNLILFPGTPETVTVFPKLGDTIPEILFPLLDPSQSADVELIVIETSPDVGEGETASITLQVTNKGPVIATGLEGSIELDGFSINYSFESLGIIPPLVAGGGFAGQFPFFRVPSLLPGETVLFPFDISAFSAEAFTFKARVIGEQLDSDPSNNESVFNLSFGSPESILEGRVYVDANLNGRFDDGEATLSDVKVTATSPNGETSSAFTGDLGFYGFTPHEAEVEVSITPKPNQILTEPAGGSKTVSLQPGATETVNFGLIEEPVNGAMGSAVGMMWDDVNADGLRQAVERGRPGEVVFLDLNHNGIQEPVTEPIAVTNDNGMFAFRDLQPGTYDVRSIVASNQYQTFPSVRTANTPPDTRFPGHRITVEAGRIASEIDFGIYTFRPSDLELTIELEHLVFDASGQILWKPLPVDLERLKQYTYGGNKVRISLRVKNRTPLEFTLDLTATDELGELILVQSSVGRTFTVPRETEREAFVEFNPKEPWVGGEPRAGMGVHLPAGKLGGGSAIAVDAVDRDLLIRPQPVVGLPGIWRDAQSFELFSSRLPAFRPDLQFFAIDDGAFPTTYTQGSLDGPLTTGSGIVADAQRLSDYLNTLRSSLGAYQVDLVAHSNAGLIARYYIQELMPPTGNEASVVRKLITLGTPHEGLPVSAAWAWTLERYRSLAPNATLPFPVNLFELQPNYIQKVFNPLIELDRGVEFYAIAGTQPNELGALPGTSAQNDGLVSLQSALAFNTPSLFLKDFAVVNESHRSLPENQEVLNLVIRALVDAPLGNNPDVNTSAEPDVFDLDTVMLETVTIGSGQTRELSFEVGSAESLWVAVSDHSHIDSVVQGPGLPLPTTPAAFLKGLWPAYFKTQKVQNPNSGRWIIQLSHDGTSPDEAQLMVMVFEKKSDIQLVTFAENLNPIGNIGIRGLFNPPGSEPVLDAKVYQVSMSGSTSSIVLSDDGTGLDQVASDGIFSGLIETTDLRPHSGLVEFSSANQTRFGFYDSNPTMHASIEVARFTRDGVETSWPMELGTSVVVETISDLNGGDWSKVIAPPTLKGGRYFLNIPIPTTGHGFFRLRFPVGTLLGNGI